MFGSFTDDEIIQSKIEELKALIEAHIEKYVDEEEKDCEAWTQTVEWLREKGRDDPDELDLIEWYLLTT